MLENTPSFDSKDIGSLAIRFQRVCKTCTSHKACLKEKCPISHCRNYLANYMRFKNQILKDVDPEKLPPRPGHLGFNEAKLEEIYFIVHKLCNRCMFHADKCFMNIIYWNVETMLGIKQRKPTSKRPGDQNTG